MSFQRFSRSALRTLFMVTFLTLTGCGGSEPDRSGATTYDVEEPSAARVTLRKTELNVGGIIRVATETTTSEPLPSPPVVVERPFPKKAYATPQAGLLTAGDVDDLLNPAQYAAYAGRFLQRQGQGLPFVDTRTRVAIRVVDANGRAVPFAKATIRRAGLPLQLVTAADGTASFYPSYDRVPAQTAVDVTSSAGNLRRSVSLADGRSILIRLPGAGHAPSAMDLALVVDTTGSMGDEMAYLRAELDTIVARLRRNSAGLDLRIGVILYRDEGDDYVVRSLPLTADVGAVRGLRADQEAGGGGDMPEAMDQAMAAAQRLQWRPDAAKAVLLVTDAPPHGETVGPTLAAAQQLRARGVQIVPVAASGVDDTAQYVLRTMAALTQGRYIFLTDDSGIGDAHAEPDVACYLVTRLDQVVARVLAGIATGQRIEPAPQDIIRTVGDYDRGRCRSQAQDGQRGAAAR